MKGGAESGLNLELMDLIAGGRKPWRRILLYGPPGTGWLKIPVYAIAHYHRKDVLENETGNKKKININDK